MAETGEIFSNSNLPVRPKNAEELRTLCDALQRNDPTVTSISTLDLSMIGGCARDLGHALQRNTVVSTIELEVDNLVISAEELRDRFLGKGRKLMMERTRLLFHWMKRSSSLRNVKIRPGLRHIQRHFLLEKILDVLVKNGNIQSFEAHSHIDSLRLSSLTPVLQANTSLKALYIYTQAYPVPDSDDILEDSARAVGALHQLEVLSIAPSRVDPFLRHLRASPAFTSTLRELTLDFQEPNHARLRSRTDFEASLLCEVLSGRSCRLERLELKNLDLYERSWTLLSSALLRSNPSSLLRTLVLTRIHFSEEASTLFLQDIQSNPVSLLQLPEPLGEQAQPQLHHILDLHLACAFATPQQGMKLGNMLCGSLLQHFTLDFEKSFSQRQLLGGGGRRLGLPRRDKHDFFHVLTAQATAICLRSMRLLNAEVNDLRRLAPYIATTVHLRHLTVYCSRGEQDGVMPVPNVFHSSLRQNSSLHKVDLSITRFGHRYTPSDAILRRIRAYTTRNCVLPQLAATTSFRTNTNRQGNDAEPPAVAATAAATGAPPSASAFPTLGTVAEHSPTMAPNTFLKAFLAASEALIPHQQPGDPA